MNKLISILIAMLFIINNYSLSNPEQEDIIKEADLLLDMMEYESAIMNYLKVLSQNPQQRDIRKNIGYAYFQKEKIDDALKFLKKELILFPDNGDTYDLFAYILYKHKKAKEAYDFFKSHDLQMSRDEDNPNSGLGDFILGINFKERRKFDTARIFLRRAIDRGYHPIKCYMQLADIELIQAAELNKDNIKAFFNILAEAKKTKEELYELHGIRYEIFESDFMCGLLYYIRFKSEFERRHYSLFSYLHLAYKSFKEALRLKPDSKDTLFNLACIYYNFNQFQEAADYFKRILEIDPENTDIAFYLDCCLKKLKKSTSEKPVSDPCPKFLNLSKDFIDKPDMEYQYQFKNDILFILQNINYLALEFVKKGRPHESIRRYRNGLKIYPESPEINFNLGMVFYWQNNFKKAEKHTLLALRRKYFYITMPDFLVPGRLSYYEREEFLKKGQDPIHKSPDIPLSEWTFDAALKEGSYFMEAYDLLGNIYFKKGELNKSVSAFKKVIEIKRDDPMGRYNLGCTYHAIDEQEDAEEEWKKAIKFEKEARKREKKESISKNQLAISLIVLKRPVSFQAHKSLGRLYLDRNLPDKALKEFEKAMKLEPGDPEPYYELGRIYQAKSDLDEKHIRKAIFYYEKYLYLGGEKEKEVKRFLKSLK